MKINIMDELIGEGQPIYFIADIAANHDGNLERAKKLITLAKKAGANAAKFQHFKANKIVSDYGFKNLVCQTSHQSNWKKSVFDVYKDAELNRSWTNKLAKHCKQEKIHFFSSPYDFEAIEILDKLTPAYKIGSGDLNWDEMLIALAKKKKPIL
jgi:N-acetylneuraminate synthase